MYQIDKDNSNQFNEINVRPIREIDNLSTFGFKDLIWFIVLLIPILIIFLCSGFHWWGLVIAGVYALLDLIFCFFKIGGKKLRVLIFRAFKRLFKQKTFTDQKNKEGLNEVDTFFRISKIEDNKIYVSDTHKCVLSVFRINGYDLSLSDQNGANKAISAWNNFFATNIDYQIICAGIKYKTTPKTFKLKKTNSTIEHLESDYNKFLESLNSNKDIKQNTYFLIIKTDKPEEVEAKLSLINDILIDGKASLTPANRTEINQLLDLVWFSGLFNSGAKIANPLKQVQVYRDCVKLTAKQPIVDPKTKKEVPQVVYCAFKTINLFPSIASQGYLHDIFNNPDYTWIIKADTLRDSAAKDILEKSQTALFSTISSNWFKKKATDTQRMNISEVSDQLEDVIESLVKHYQTYTLRKCEFTCIIRAGSRKQLNKKVSAFRTQMSNYFRHFKVQDNTWLQFEGFIKTRLHPICAYEEKIKNHSLFSKSINSPKRFDWDKDNELYLLNTSLGLGYIFSDTIANASTNSWYKGVNLKSSYDQTTFNPVFADYWSINERYNSFSRIYLAQTGKGKTWTLKRDLINDRLDDNYIITIDPKEDYVSMCKALGGSNLDLGIESKNTDKLNVFDVLVTPNDTDNNNNDINISCLRKTFAKNDAIIQTLLNLNPAEDKYLISAWRYLQEYVYRTVCKFSEKTNFKLVAKNKMPIMEDFIKACDKLIKADSEYKTNLINLKTLLMPYGKNGNYGYLFNEYSNVDWTSNTWFNINISAISNLDISIFAAYITYFMYMAIDLMIGNKNSGRKFNLYIDEFHTIRDLPIVLRSVAKFIKICRSHNGSLSIVDLGLGIVSGDANRLYKEIFEQMRFGFYFNASENDINKLADMLAYSGNPLSPAERRFISLARPGECLMVCGAYDRLRLKNDVSYWKWFFEQTKSEGKLNG